MRGQEATERLRRDCFADQHRDLIDRLRTSPKHLGIVEGVLLIYEDAELREQIKLATEAGLDPTEILKQHRLHISK